MRSNNDTNNNRLNEICKYLKKCIQGEPIKIIQSRFLIVRVWTKNRSMFLSIFWTLSRPSLSIQWQRDIIYKNLSCSNWVIKNRRSASDMLNRNFIILRHLGKVNLYILLSLEPFQLLNQRSSETKKNVSFDSNGKVVWNSI